MSQSNFIFGALFVAFVVFITAKGELPIYLGFLTSKAQSGSGPPQSPPPPPVIGSNGQPMVSKAIVNPIELPTYVMPNVGQ